MKTAKKRKTRIISILLISSIVIGFILVQTDFVNEIKYYFAVQNYNDDRFVQAKKTFIELKDFKDSEEYYRKSYYNEALELLFARQYVAAKEAFYDLKDYKDGWNYYRLSYYNEALGLFENKEYAAARNIFQELKDFEYSWKYIKEIDYIGAVELFENGKIEDARKAFVELGDFKDSKEKIKGVDYLLALGMLKNGQKKEAKSAFYALGDFKDSVKQYETLVIQNPKVGEHYQGGIIGYILRPGDKGYDPKVFHGLIVSENELHSSWYPQEGKPVFIKGTRTTIGSGMANTEKIIAHYGPLKYSYENPNYVFESNHYIAILARTCEDGGYKDWYLPSRDELYAFYKNKHLIGIDWAGMQWTSSDIDEYSIYGFNMDTGEGAKDTIWLYKMYGDGPAYITARAVRSF
jgi:hypothetical protein